MWGIFMVDKISREEEKHIPDFTSHTEAITWFKKKYGKFFVADAIENINGETVYFYRLILNEDVYFEELKKLVSTGHTTGTDFLDSHQPIEIMEDGRVHIVH